MKISHEVPISLLERSREFNDYDYCLAHLFHSRAKYREYYLDSVKKKRHVLLDNSIFELGTSFDPVEYAKIIEELRPTEYIVPDVLEDSQGTCEHLENWLKNYSDMPGNKIAVVQGKTYEDIKTCIDFIASKREIRKIGVSFDYSLYNDLAAPYKNKLNKWQKYAVGRTLLLEKLEEDLKLPRNKKYHLLGASLPQEFMFASFFSFTKFMFESVDTSNPIVHGLFKVKYTPGIGLNEKRTKKLADLIDSKVNDRQWNCIQYNVNMFKEFVTRGY